MRRAIVRYCGESAGVLEETGDGFRFSYLEKYLQSPGAKSVSLTLPLKTESYQSDHLFSFFAGLVSEGTLRELQCREYQIDLEDEFGLLLATAGSDVIGCVTIEEMLEA